MNFQDLQSSHICMLAWTLKVLVKEIRAFFLISLISLMPHSVPSEASSKLCQEEEYKNLYPVASSKITSVFKST